MALATDQWGFNTVSATEISLSLAGNESNSDWELISFSVDGGPNIKDRFISVSDSPDFGWLDSGTPFGTHNNVGDGRWDLTLTSGNVLVGSGIVEMQIYTADTVGAFFTGTVNFSYTVPMRTRMRLVSSSSNTRLRLIST